MSTIRRVLQHPTTGRWAYVEYDALGCEDALVLGGETFETQVEAMLYSAGFVPGSYEHQTDIDIQMDGFSHAFELMKSDVQHLQDRYDHFQRAFIMQTKSPS